MTQAHPWEESAKAVTEAHPARVTGIAKQRDSGRKADSYCISPGKLLPPRGKDNGPLHPRHAQARVPFLSFLFCGYLPHPAHPTCKWTTARLKTPGHRPCQPLKRKYLWAKMPVDLLPQVAARKYACNLSSLPLTRLKPAASSRRMPRARVNLQTRTEYFAPCLDAYTVMFRMPGAGRTSAACATI